MSRPCNCNNCGINKPYQTGDCRVCWLYHNNFDYRQHWDTVSIPDVVTVKNECVFRSALPVDRKGCGTCSKEWIYNCSIYGNCAAVSKTAAIRSCATCSDYEEV